MNRAERRRLKREIQNAGNLEAVAFAGPSPCISPVVKQFVREHKGHTLIVDDDLKNSLTLRCLDCADKDEFGEG